MNLFSYLTNGTFLLYVLLGCVSGLFVGALPGLSVTMATALLVSLTYTWETEHALATIMGIYVIGVFSGALSAILLNIPGAPSSVITTLDGYPMAKRGEGARAIRLATVYSVLGSTVGFLALALLAKPMTKLALLFMPMDFFLLCLFGLLSIGSLTAKDPVKGWASAVIGLLLSMVGMDPVAGIPRLTFGIRSLRTGIGIVPALIGLFGFAQVIVLIRTKGAQAAEQQEKSSEATRMGGLLRHWKLGIVSALIGTGIGVLPGAGGPIASLTAYGFAKRWIRKPTAPFGKGAEEGVAASEAANNAVVGGALIPTLTIGIPGDAVTAILLSVFLIHGVEPGPLFLTRSQDAFAAILAAGFFGTVLLLPLGLWIAPKLAKVLQVPKSVLTVLVTLLCVAGSYWTESRWSDVLVMLLFGIGGYLLNRRGFPSAPITLGLVLGGTMDTQFRRAVSLAASEDAPLRYLFGRPITLLLAAGILLFLLNRLLVVKHRAKARSAKNEFLRR